MTVSSISPITLEGQPQELSSFMRSGVMYVVWQAPITDTGLRRIHWKPHTGLDFTEITPSFATNFHNLTVLFFPSSDQILAIWDDGSDRIGQRDGSLSSARFNVLTGELVSGPTVLFPGSQPKLSYRTTPGNSAVLYYLTAKSGGVYGRISTDGGVTWQSGEPILTNQVLSSTKVKVVPYDSEHVSIAQLGGDPRALSEIGMFQRTRPLSSILGVPTGHVLDGNTLALWRLDETGTTWADQTGNYPLTQTGSPVPTVGRFGSGRKFTAANQYGLNAADSTARTQFTDGEWTVEFWYYLSTADFTARFPGPSTEMRLLSLQGNEVGGPNENTLFAIQFHKITGFPSTRYVFFVAQHGNNLVQGIDAGTTLNSYDLDRWQHFAWRSKSDGAGGFNWDIFRDGVIIGSATGKVAPSDGSAATWRVGGTDPLTYMVGVLDDIRISKVPRTDAEIAASVLGGPPTFYIGEPSKFDNVTLADNLRGGLVLSTDNTKLYHLDGVRLGADDQIGAVARMVVSGTKVTAGPQGHILDSATTALWRFDETSGNLIDERGLRTLSLVSGTYPAVAGKINGARTPSVALSEFTGPQIGSDFPGVAGDLSVEFWGYLASGPAGYIWALNFGGIEHASGGGSAQNPQFSIDVHNSGFIRMLWERGNRIQEIYSLSPPFALDVWHHFAGVRYLSGGSAFVELYVDGVLLGTSGPLVPPDGGGSCMWVVGTNYASLSGAGTEPGFRQDDTRVSFSRRTSAEILESYTRGIAAGAYAGPAAGGNGDDLEEYSLIPAQGSLDVDLPGTSYAVALGVSSTHAYVAEYADNSGSAGQLAVVNLSTGSTGTPLSGVTGVRAVCVANFLSPPLIFVASTESGVERLRVYEENALTPTLLLNTKLPARANSIGVVAHPSIPTSARVLVSMIDRFNIYDYNSAATPVLLVDSHRFPGGGQFFETAVATNGNIVVAAGNVGVLVLSPSGRVRAQIQVSGKIVPEWQPTTVYVAGQFYKPRARHQFSRNRMYFRCATGGTSGSSEPAWAATGTVIDNSVQWTAQGVLDGVVTDVALDEVTKRIYAVGVIGGDLGTEGRVWVLNAGGLL